MSNRPKFSIQLRQFFTYLKVTIIYGDNILRIGGIAHFARIKFCAYAACASGVAPCARSRASASMVRAQEKPHSLHALRVPFIYALARSERAHRI